MVFLLAICLLCCSSCSTLFKQGGEMEKKDTSETTSSENTITQTTTEGSFFDRSKINSSNWQLELEPINPKLPVSFYTDKTGRTQYENAKPKWSNTNTQTEKDTGGAETTQTDQTHQTDEATKTQKDESQSWFTKFKMGIPWYVWFFGFLFLFLGIVASIIIKKLFDKINLLTGDLQNLKSKLES